MSKGASDNHHIGRVAAKLKPAKHVFRARRLCVGNAEYERKMAEAQAEFNDAEQRRKMKPKRFNAR